MIQKLKYARLLSRVIRLIDINVYFWLKEFVINTPTFEDSKIWVGNLGKTATHAAVYAQLITPDGNEILKS